MNTSEYELALYPWKKLLYKDHDQLITLPDWCQFFIQIGLRLAQVSSNSRVMMVVCVPTRAFAAAFSGIGIIGNLTTSNNPFGNHVKMLENLKDGTPVFVHEKERKIKGLFRGIKDLGDGNKRIGVEVSAAGPRKNGAIVNYYLADQATKIVPVEKIAASIANKSHTPRTLELIRNREFIKGVLTDQILWELATISRVDFLLVGLASILNIELKETTFAINKGDFTAEGNLQDILRTRRFSGQNDTFRSDIVSPDKQYSLDSTDIIQPRIVIFDGAQGFLKSRITWPNTNWLVILDRTEPLFSEAISLVNEIYTQRMEDWNPIDCNDVLPSIDIVTCFLRK